MKKIIVRIQNKHLMWVPLFAASGLIPLAIALSAGINGGEMSGTAYNTCTKLMKQLGIEGKPLAEMLSDIDSYVEFLKMYKNESKLRQTHTVSEWRLIYEQVTLCQSSLRENDGEKFMQQAFEIAERGEDARTEFLGGAIRCESEEEDHHTTATRDLLDAISDESSDYSLVI